MNIYEWDVSSLGPTSGTASIKITNISAPFPTDNLSGGSANGILPLVVRVPGQPLRVRVEPSVFSPNGDGALDFATASITASKPWKLSVVDQGIVATGDLAAEPLVVAWDGNIRGKGLGDGQYRLKLEEDSATPSVLPVEATVSIDTTPPRIETLAVSEIDMRPGFGT